MSLYQTMKHHFWTREFVRFLLIGCFNTFSSVAVSSICLLFMDDGNIAFNIGYITINIVSYWLNSKLVFPTPLSVGRYLKFALSYVPNYIVQNMIVFISYNVLAVPPVVSYLISAVLGVPVTFLCIKIFAFGRH